MKAGIVGLPNVGKSTLFNCLSNAKAQSANFPFCTIEPNIGIVNVPDKRLYDLSDLVKPQRVVPATVEIVDIAGLVKGASKGEGLGNKFLANIRETNALMHVLRCFNDDNITHVDGEINPIKDKETIDIELQLKDIEVLEKIREKNLRIANSGDSNAKRSVDVAEKYIAELEKGISLRDLEFSDDERSIIDPLQLITIKPVIYICNVDETSLNNKNNYVEQVQEKIKNENADMLIIATAIESEIAELETHEQSMFLDELGLKKPGIHYLIKSVYNLLELETFFTAGEKEVRAWTIRSGSTAPQAAGVIHSDFEKGFIRAEVISYDNYIKYGSEQACKESGKLSIEGKSYIIEDGDVIHFRFNV